MSLDLLKERFSVNHLTKDDIIPELEKEIENRENTILNLEEKGNNLANQIVTLEKEKNNILQELNKARHFEEGAFAIKEKDYINELQSKENIIKEIKSEFNPLYKKIDEQKDRLSYTDDVIKKYANTNKELNEKINKLNYRSNFEKKNSKEIISEIESKRKKAYQDYVNNLDAYENAITSKNEIITSHKTKLNKSLNKLKEAKNIIDNLKFENEKNKNIKEELKNKEEHILNLNEETNSLSEEVKHFSSLSNENNILYEDEIKHKNNDMDKQKQKLKENTKKIKKLNTKISNLESKNKESEKIISKKTSALSEFAVENSSLQNQLVKAENFQNIITNKKDEFKKSIKEKNNLKTFKLVNLLTNISREKQGNEKLTWRNWLKIPENDYLLNLDEAIAKKIFNKSNYLIQEAINNIDKRRTRGGWGNDGSISFSGNTLSSGTSDYVSTTFNPDTYNLSEGFTVSYWVRPDELGGTMFALGRKPHNNERFQFGIQNEDDFFVGVGRKSEKTTEHGMSVGNWYHWAVTYSGQSSGQVLKIYRDGTELKSNTNTRWDRTGTTTDATVYFGGYNSHSTSGYTAGWACDLDEVAIFDKVIDVSTLYNSGTPSDLTNESGLVGYWRFEEGSGHTVEDLSPNNNHGTLTTADTGLPTWSTDKPGNR